MGGPSPEHDVSLNTGREILKALDRKKYVAHPVTVTKEGMWLLSNAARVHNQGGHSLKKRTALTLQPAHNKNSFPIKNIDVAFIAMHGRFGEDGTVQALLETFGIPYTGSGVLASALGMDKPRSLLIFRQAGLSAPDFCVFSKDDWKKRRSAVLSKILRSFRFPFITKPADAGSSVGVAIIKKKSELRHAILSAFRHSNTIMAQVFVKGKELTCGVLENRNGELEALMPTEIIPRPGDFYDYSSKYGDGGSTHLIPPKNMSPSVIGRIQAAACIAHRALGCRGFSRTDFILASNGTLFVLELNTIPGMTQTSLLPEAAKAAGISFTALLDRILETAEKKGKQGV